MMRGVQKYQSSAKVILTVMVTLMVIPMFIPKVNGQVLLGLTEVNSYSNYLDRFLDFGYHFLSYHLDHFLSYHHHFDLNLSFYL